MTPSSVRTVTLLVLAVALVAVAALGVHTYKMGGLRNVIGRLLYDQREEGRLRVGDPAPDIALTALEGTVRSSLLADRGDKALVLVFGSFT